MTIDFHDRKLRNSYTGREADDSWLELVSGKLSLHGLKAADIGCGGGIYTKALAELGAGEVTGVDFSLSMLEGAAGYCSGLKNVRFLQGNALQTGLPETQYGIVLERALIHHLDGGQLTDCFREAYRILQQGGSLLVQDRTPEDCLLPGSKEHLRGYFFERFSRLSEKETARRHTSQLVRKALAEAGFTLFDHLVLWETRQRYSAFSDFRSGLLKRTGRSILHELDDSELLDLADFIQLQTGYGDDEAVEEKDRWTVWIARKD